MEPNQQLVHQMRFYKVECLECVMLSLFFILNKNVSGFLSSWLDHPRTWYLLS